MLSEHAGAKSAHILVYDRHEQRVIEETISPYMVLAMRNMYQTPVGRLMMGSGAHRALLDLTRREGRYMNSPASIKVCLSIWLSVCVTPESESTSVMPSSLHRVSIA